MKIKDRKKRKKVTKEENEKLLQDAKKFYFKIHDEKQKRDEYRQQQKQLEQLKMEEDS